MANVRHIWPPLLRILIEYDLFSDLLIEDLLAGGWIIVYHFVGAKSLICIAILSVAHVAGDDRIVNYQIDLLFD